MFLFSSPFSFSFSLSSCFLCTLCLSFNITFLSFFCFSAPLFSISLSSSSQTSLSLFLNFFFLSSFLLCFSSLSSFLLFFIHLLHLLSPLSFKLKSPLSVPFFLHAFLSLPRIFSLSFFRLSVVFSISLLLCFTFPLSFFCLYPFPFSLSPFFLGLFFYLHLFF